MYNMRIKIAFFVKQKILSIAGFLKDLFLFSVFNFSMLYVVHSPGDHTVFILHRRHINNIKSFSKRGSTSEFICYQ